MVYRDRVENGVIVLQGDVNLPEGTEVTVSEPTPEQPRSIDGAADVLLKYAGAVKSWPADMAKNHDHYLHGAPSD